MPVWCILVVMKYCCFQEHVCEYVDIEANTKECEDPDKMGPDLLVHEIEKGIEELRNGQSEA